MYASRHSARASRWPGSWVKDAACGGFTDLERIFFPERGNSAAAQLAKSICASCPVRSQCRDFALDTHQPFGIWGGTTVRERRRLRRRRQAAMV